jgi:hypothetical protein
VPAVFTTAETSDIEGYYTTNPSLVYTTTEVNTLAGFTELLTEVEVSSFEGQPISTWTDTITIINAPLTYSDVETEGSADFIITTQAWNYSYEISTAVRTQIWADGSSPVIATLPSCSLPTSYSKCQSQWQTWAQEVAVPEPMPPAEPG